LSDIDDEMQVVLLQDGSIIKTVSLGPSNFFDFGAHAKGSEYTVKVQSSLSTGVYDINTSEERITLDKPAHLKLTFSAQPHNRELHELTNTPFFGLLFGITVVLCIVYYKSVIH
jgi:hypothetical protein